MTFTKSMTSFLVVATVASTALAQSPPANAKPISVRSLAEDGKAKASSDPVVDDETRRMAMELRRQLEGSPEELRNVAEKIGRPLIASLKHDLDIARVNERRKRMEGARVRVVEMAAEAKSERKELLKQMNEELATIRKQFADDTEICETEGVALVEAFKVRLKSLKEREQECQAKVDETSQELIALRRDAASRQRARWLAGRTHLSAPPIRSPVPRLIWVKKDRDRPADAAPRRSVSLKDALAGLKEFE